MLVSENVTGWSVTWLSTLNSNSSRQQYPRRPEKKLRLGGHSPSQISLYSDEEVSHFFLPDKSSYSS